jgi:uncharacterized protein DUF695
VWPFGRKYASRDQITIGQDWKVGQSKYAGKPLIARFNAGLQAIAGHPDYRYQVGIAVPLKSPNEHGLPSLDEDRQLAGIEDEITRTLEEDRESILVGVISTNGMREFVCYSSDADSVRRKFDRLQHSVTSHDLQLMIRLDPKWAIYKQFL